MKILLSYKCILCYVISRIIIQLENKIIIIFHYNKELLKKYDFVLIWSLFHATDDIGTYSSMSMEHMQL